MSGYEITEDDVERYIDHHGMVHLLTMLENICHEKADHLRTNWQDNDSAKIWQRGAERIYKLATYNWLL